MAVTKIHGIKTTVDKAIEYICNPDKTDQNLYISSFACSPETAVLDFKYTLDHTHDCRDPHNTNKAFHLIQAFSPGEVSYMRKPIKSAKNLRIAYWMENTPMS